MLYNEIRFIIKQPAVQRARPMVFTLTGQQLAEEHEKASRN
jgi:hypothetical protein